MSQMWRGYYLCVLLKIIHLALMFFALLQIDMFKGNVKFVEAFFKQIIVMLVTQIRFAIVFPLPSSCLSSLMQTRAKYIP